VPSLSAISPTPNFFSNNEKQLTLCDKKRWICSNHSLCVCIVLERHHNTSVKGKGLLTSVIDCDSWDVWQVDMLSEINIAPRILTNFTGVMPPQFKKDLDSYLKTRSPVTFLSDLRSNLQVS
jgi:hypothetical protein